MGVMIQLLFLSSVCAVIQAQNQAYQGAPLLSLFPSTEGAQQPRREKSLLVNNRFPFHGQRQESNLGHHGVHHGDHHGDSRHGAAHHAPHHDNNIISQRQLPPAEGSDGTERCIEKVMMVESVDYDQTIECKHSYEESCHTTYTTEYQPMQEEECEESFQKNCYIHYQTKADTEDIEVCTNEPVKDCDIDAPEVCENTWRNQCTKTQHAHPMEQDEAECVTENVVMCKPSTNGYETTEDCSTWPKQVCNIVTKNITRYTPEVKCEKVAIQVCGPGPCPFVPGPEVCRTEQRTITKEVPVESCDLNPFKSCEFVTKLVPMLVPKESCYQVPKEVCDYSKRVPRTVKRPVIKKWCYTPGEHDHGYIDHLIGNYTGGGSGSGNGGGSGSGSTTISTTTTTSSTTGSTTDGSTTSTTTDGSNGGGSTTTSTTTTASTTTTVSTTTGSTTTTDSSGGGSSSTTDGSTTSTTTDGTITSTTGGPGGSTTDGTTDSTTTDGSNGSTTIAPPPQLYHLPWFNYQHPLAYDNKLKYYQQKLNSKGGYGRK